jgi:teichuronic acid biosynthesis glycosyltransferase TuaC
MLKKIYKKFSFEIIDAHYVYPDGFAGVLFGRKFNVPTGL